MTLKTSSEAPLCVTTDALAKRLEHLFVYQRTGDVVCVLVAPLGILAEQSTTGWKRNALEKP